MNALAHGPQNFLVPDRGNIFEIAVDNPDGSGPFRRDPINITLGGRRQKSRIELLGGFVCSDGRTHKHIHTHAAASKMARARRPKEYSTELHAGSYSGMTTRATGIRNSGWVRCTTQTRCNTA